MELLMYESWLQFLLTLWYIKNLYKSDWCILEDLIEVISDINTLNMLTSLQQCHHPHFNLKKKKSQILALETLVFHSKQMWLLNSCFCSQQMWLLKELKLLQFIHKIPAVIDALPEGKWCGSECLYTFRPEIVRL